MSTTHNQTLPEGTQLGVYEIKEILVIDIFDIHYRAWNHHLKGWVKIHEYFPYDFAIRADDGLRVQVKSPADKENFDYGLKTFLEQSEILLQIDHPNIVKTENILHFNGTAYVIMAYQEGVPLSEFVRSPAAFSETELRQMLSSILNALQNVHKYKFIHGGIQPEAIILDKEGVPWLTNFTNAKLASAIDATKYASVLADGYTPLELYGKSTVSGPASDFYALGATLYFCITNQQPITAQGRILALSKREPDPIAALSGTSDFPYNPELLAVIDWMLKPEYHDRPQSVDDILTRINLVSFNDQSGQIDPKLASADTAEGQSFLNVPLLISGVIGLAAVIIFGFWFATKPTEKSGDTEKSIAEQAETPVIPPIKEIVAATTPDVQPVPPVSPTVPKTPAEPNVNQPEPSLTLVQTRNNILEAEKKTELAELQEKTNKDQTVVEKTAPADIKPKVKKLRKNDNHTLKVATVKHKAVATTKAKKPKMVAKPVDEGSVEGNLAAARVAMKDVRLTTPAGNSAQHYYQQVLAKDPDNVEARAGLKRIVNRYAWYIKKTKSEGDINKAKRVLQKAESVIPDDPKLEDIREELSGTKK